MYRKVNLNPLILFNGQMNKCITFIYISFFYLEVRRDREREKEKKRERERERERERGL